MSKAAWRISASRASEITGDPAGLHAFATPARRPDPANWVLWDGSNMIARGSCRTIRDARREAENAMAAAQAGAKSSPGSSPTPRSEAR